MRPDTGIMAEEKKGSPAEFRRSRGPESSSNGDKVVRGKTACRVFYQGRCLRGPHRPTWNGSTGLSVDGPGGGGTSLYPTLLRWKMRDRPGSWLKRGTPERIEKEEKRGEGKKGEGRRGRRRKKGEKERRRKGEGEGKRRKEGKERGERLINPLLAFSAIFNYIYITLLHHL